MPLLRDNRRTFQTLLPYALACTALLLLYQPLPSTLEENVRNLPQGLFLGYGLNAPQRHPIALSMPLSPVLNFLIYLLPAAAELWIWPMFYILASAMAFALAAELTACAWAGALAAALCALAFSLRLPGLLCIPEQMIYALACALASYALIRRAATPRNIRTELFTALSIGLTLFIKSPLLLLPPLLALCDIVAGKLKRKETTWNLLALLCVVPYAMLLPWTWMNHALDHSWLLFEGKRADQNLITGALGIVFTIEGAYPLAKLPENSSFLLWAMKTVATHPLSYATGVLKRFYSLLAWYPLAAAGLAAAATRLRSDSRFRALLFFLGYYTAIHCLLSIQERYFVPIWPIALAGAAVFLFAPRTTRPAHKTPRAAGIVAAAIFALLAALYLLSSTLLLLYPGRKAPARTGRKYSAPMLALLSYQVLSNKGNIKRAEALARQALLSRQSDMAHVAYLSVLIAKGIDITAPLKNYPLTANNPQNNRESSYLLLANALRQRRGDVAAQLRQALLNWRYADSSFRKVTSLEESQLQKTQMEETSSFLDLELPGLIRRFPNALRPQMTDKLRANGSRSPQLTKLLMETLLSEPLAESDAATERPCPKQQSSAEETKQDAIYAAIRKFWEHRPLSPQNLRCLYKELSVLGMKGELLKEFAIAVRRNPKVQRRFQEIERLHETKQYAALVKPAQAYLRDYPYDQVATLFLAVAFLNIENLPQAKDCLDRAAALPLEPHERNWLVALQDNHARALFSRHKEMTQALLKSLLGEKLSDGKGPQQPCRQLPAPAGETEQAAVYAAIKQYWELRPLTYQNLRCLYEELKTKGMDEAQLKEFSLDVRRNPTMAPRLLALEQLHETRQYAALVEPAEEYLRDYPYDQVATLFLAVAYLNTGKLEQAKNCLDRAATLPLEPQEKRWLKALRKNYAKEMASK